MQFTREKIECYDSRQWKRMMRMRCTYCIVVAKLNQVHDLWVNNPASTDRVKYEALQNGASRLKIIGYYPVFCFGQF